MARTYNANDFKLPPLLNDALTRQCPTVTDAFKKAKALSKNDILKQRRVAVNQIIKQCAGKNEYRLA